MRTLSVLSAILLLAFLTHAEPLGESPEEQPEDQNQDMAIYFTGDERATREASGFKKVPVCRCRIFSCGLGEQISGFCKFLIFSYKLCCH
nr:neutrophil antibiotic peptide NP-3A-like [Dasypus novemcinctus]